MKHFVAYHNTEKMGYSFQEATPYSVGTSKSVNRLLGNRVWSISGEGQPRQYYLHDTWIVTRTGPSEQPGFGNFASGTDADGTPFDPPIHLNLLPWFSAFLKSQNNFSLGLQPITDQFVGEFELLAQNQIDRPTETVAPAGHIILPAESAVEGRALLRLHRTRERKPRLIALKKQQAIRDTRRLACEACGFDFATVYGDLGGGFAECHHRLPLADTGETRTTLADLAVVCANCHRMLHRRPWRTVEELRELIRSRAGS